MPYLECLWDLDDDLDGNVHHIAEHGLSKNDVEDVLRKPLGEETSLSSGRPIAFGLTRRGNLIAVVYEQIDDITVYPITAYFLDS